MNQQDDFILTEPLVLGAIPTPEEIAERLRSNAEGMQKQITEKLNPAIGNQNPTPRRTRIAEGIMQEGRELKYIQKILYALANAHDSGAIETDFPLLGKIRFRKHVDAILLYGRIIKYNWSATDVFPKHQKELEKMGIHSAAEWIEAYQELMQLADNRSAPDAQSKADELRRLKNELYFKKIPGFFPTPPALIKQMLDFANIENGDAVLDPSAGMGDILVAVRNEYGDDVSISAIEINYSLRKVIELQGIELLTDDFMEYDGQSFDKILMNPPFEREQDIDHVRRAFDFLQPGGTLVAIVSEGVFFRQDKKAEQFRDWLNEHGGKSTDAIKDAFKKGPVSTGVVVRIVVIQKEGRINNEMRELERLADERIKRRENGDFQGSYLYDFAET